VPGTSAQPRPPPRKSIAWHPRGQNIRHKCRFAAGLLRGKRNNLSIHKRVSKTIQHFCFIHIRDKRTELCDIFKQDTTQEMV
jgi:hypothetical protein